MSVAFRSQHISNVTFFFLYFNSSQRLMSNLTCWQRQTALKLVQPAQTEAHVFHILQRIQHLKLIESLGCSTVKHILGACIDCGSTHGEDVGFDQKTSVYSRSPLYL